MTLSIESPEVLALIEKISQLTGEDAETVVYIAVREQLERLDAEENAAQQRIPAYGSADAPQSPFQEHAEAAVDNGETLYGEDGPRK